MSRYAEGTTVAASKTRGEIEAIVAKHGATRFAFGYVAEDRAGISFVWGGYLVRFTVPLPNGEDKQLRKRHRRRFSSSSARCNASGSIFQFDRDSRCASRAGSKPSKRRSSRTSSPPTTSPSGSASNSRIKLLPAADRRQS